MTEQTPESDRRTWHNFNKEELKVSEERIKTELKQAIDTSQEDTIEALPEVIHTGYNMHEERIKHLEDQARVYNSLVHPHLSCWMSNLKQCLHKRLALNMDSIV